MAIIVKTITSFPLNGSDREFDITFDYLARRFVKVAIIGGEARQELTLGTDYRFATKTRIRTTLALGSPWERIEIRRETSATDRVVNFSDGSVLRAKDLNASQIQAIHIAEEARDGTALGISQDDLGNLDAKGRPIVNVGTPSGDGDAATKGYVDGLNSAVLRMDYPVEPITGDSRGRLISIDGNGNPVAIIAATSSEAALAQLLRSLAGASEVGTTSGNTVQEELDGLSANTISNYKSLWSIAMSSLGYNLVEGSFMEGAIVTDKHDVVIDVSTGSCYKYTHGLPFTLNSDSQVGDGWVKVVSKDTHFKGSNGSHLVAGDVIPIGTMSVSLLTTKGILELFLTSPTVTLSTVVTTPSLINKFLSYTITTTNGELEVMPKEILELRGFNAYPTSTREVHANGWGVKGDGSDDRECMQRAVYAGAGGSITFDGSKTYFLIFTVDGQGNTCIDLPSNIRMFFNGATIQCSSNNFTNYQIFSAYKKKNIAINDVKIIGDLDTHTGSTGEAGYGILLRCCESVTINNAHISKCWGDGLLLGSDTISTNQNITISHSVFDDNRRQGSSVGGGVGIVYDTCLFSNTGKTKATAPAAGLDIEPDNNKVADLDVKVVNCRSINNAGGGIHVILHGCLTAPTLRPGVCEVNVKVIGWTSFQDGSYDTTVSRAALRVGGSTITPITNRLFGGIDFTSCTISRTATAAIRLTNPITAYPPIRFNSILVNDVYSGVPDGSTMPTSCIIFMDIFPTFTDSPEMQIGDIDFNGLTYRDSRGLTFSENATQINHRVKRPVWHQNLSPNTSLAKVRFRHFKTDIVPDSLNFLMNGERGDYCSFDTDDMLVDVTAAITPAITGEWWGLGITPVLKGAGVTTFNVHLPSTDGRVGTYQHIKSHLPIGKPLQFHPGTTNGNINTIIFSDGVSTTEPKVPVRTMGDFTFYCPAVGVWVQN